VGCGVCADDHARIKLKVESSPSRSDYINASPIIEHDPRMPAYIATQGPLSHTIADFWQVSSWKEGFSRDQWSLRAAGEVRMASVPGWCGRVAAPSSSC